MSIQIEMPEHYLLIIAAYGNMGSGELPDSMRAWARKICLNNNLGEKLLELQTKNTIHLRARISNILGASAMQEIDASISEVLQKLHE